MPDNSTNTRSILKNDPAFEGLDFATLRAEGVSYVAELSGKIWTDHNIHDPGITMLELLCYALIDLGYRTRLPAVDIFSREPGDASPEDNFFTPAQALTCNPVTIMDFRKLLIDIKEVKNAWLEVNEEWLDCKAATHPSLVDTSQPWEPFDAKCRTFLNGLYKVYIELYKGPNGPEKAWTRKEKEQIEAVVEKVREVLMAHRNLCEDFVSITVLCKEKIGVCADIELEPAADAEKVYVKMTEILKAFFSPVPRYYTLPQLLEKGKPIEDIFAGRPYLEESHGFVDTAELEAIPFRKEIHVSDVYNALFGIPGIRTIRKLRLRKCGSTDNSLPGECDWKYSLSENHTAEFSADCSGFRFTRNGMPVTVNEKKYRDFFALNYSLSGKVLHGEPSGALDIPVPKGIYHQDLGRYYSIQNELPRVYGISEGGLPDTASTLRKAQALQLKGYLLFFDQLLANYLSQLSQLRKLFAFRNSKKEAFTYFTSLPQQVPDLDRLLRFGAGNGDDQGTIQGIPVAKSRIDDLVAQDKLKNADILNDFDKLEFTTAADRDAALYTLMEDLQNRAYTICTSEHVNGSWFFYIYTSSGEVALLGKKYYSTQKKAQLAAENLSYTGGFRENYQAYTYNQSASSYFSLELNRAGYAAYLQQLAEDKGQYLERRKAFLDHLLARFAESFTDYALLSFETLQEQELKQRDTTKKSSFLASYDKLGRNRGKACDYKRNGWNNKNKSGFEERVQAYAGMDGCGGQSLCHFEVMEYTGQYYWTITAAGRNIFKSNALFDTREETATDLEDFLKALKEKEAYQPAEMPLHDAHALSIQYREDKIAYPVLQPSKERAETVGEQLRRIIAGTPGQNDIFVSREVYRPQLLNIRGKPLRRSMQAFETAKQATGAAKSLLKKINDEEWEAADGEEKIKLDLKAGRTDPFKLVDITHFSKHVTTCADEYRWNLHNDTGAVVLRSNHTYASEQSALENMPDELTAFEPDRSSFRIDEGKEFRFDLLRDDKVLASSPVFADEETMAKAMEFVIAFCKKERENQQYTYLITDACHWQVQFADDLVFRSMALLADPENALNTWRKDKRAFRVPENYIWDWDENGQQQLSVKDDSNKIIARLLMPLQRKGGAEDLFNDIQAALANKTFKAETVKIEAGYGFRLNDPGQVLLSGYEVYKSRGAAFFTMLHVLKKAGYESMYLKSGDEGNREFTFLLKNDELQFLAEHPVLYDTEKERDEVLQQTIEFLKDLPSPAVAVKEPVSYTYNISSGERLLLASVQKFPSAREAAENANTVLIQAGDVSHYRFSQDASSGNYRVVLLAGEQELAAASGDFADEIIAAGIRNDIAETISPHLYSMQVAPFPNKWKFNFYLGIEPWRVHFQSADEYETEETAVLAYKKMAADMAGLKLQKTEGATQLVCKQKINKSHITAVLQPSPEQQEEPSVDTSLAVSQALYQLAAAEDKKALQKTVKKDAMAEQGTWVYRLRKKEDHFAYHLNCAGNGSNTDKQIKDLYDSVAHKPEYLQLCLGGDIVYKKNASGTGVSYHFVIRARNVFYPDTSPQQELVLFISSKGYASQADAEKAFEEKYLLVLKRASKAVNYGPGKFISLEEPAANTGNDCQTKEEAVVYVPRETLEIYYHNNAAAATEGLTELAKSYPVRISGKNRYKFSLYDHKKKLSCFISAAYYDTPAEAMKAFSFLLVLVRNRKNYYPWCDPDTGNTFIVIREILVESNRRFHTAAEAWGREGVEKLVGVSQAEGSFHLFARPEDCCFSFFVACRSRIVHPCTYDTAEARDQALRRLYKEFIHYQLPELPVITPTLITNQCDVMYEGRLIARLLTKSKDAKQGFCLDEFFALLERVVQLEKCVDVKGKDRFELKDADDQTIAWLDNPAYTEEEWINKLVKMAIRFPVFRKDNRYYFRMSYPGSAEAIDSSLADPCGCGEKLPPDPRDCYTAWLGGCYDTCQEAFDALYALPEKLKNEENYRAVFDCSCGAYRIEFIEQADIIAVNPQCYTSREMVCEAVERAKCLIDCEGMHLVEHILLRPRPGCDDHCGCLIPGCPDENCRFIWEKDEEDPCKPGDNRICFVPGQDPYSCIATVVLPAWPKRFRKQASRGLIARILHREAPSHVLLRILWLTPKDFCAFEEKYKSWVRWLANKKNHCGGSFDLCSFIHLLFNTRLDCWWPDEYCEPCTGEVMAENPCAELNTQENRSNTCNLTVNDIYCWSTPDCCYEYRRVVLKPEQEAEKIKLVRKRTAQYRESLQHLARPWTEDRFIGQALSYIQGNAPDEQQLLHILKGFAGGIKEADAEKTNVYRNISAVLLNFYLDRSLLDNYDPTKLSDIKQIMQKANLDKQAILKQWNGEELKGFVHEKTFQALRGILKK